MPRAAATAASTVLPPRAKTAAKKRTSRAVASSQMRTVIGSPIDGDCGLLESRPERLGRERFAGPAEVQLHGLEGERGAAHRLGRVAGAAAAADRDPAERGDPGLAAIVVPPVVMAAVGAG